ncbi:hypothetical protein Q3G72_000736 [Acer saccharum]|nr:hypothetical protein Q3G72_000736 [Acer saccharum]
MNPIRKVPMLETLEGPLFESNAIARYVAKSKPKDEPKKEESPKPKAVEEEEEEEAPKPKPKNPLDLLPPSKMILDERKRLYLNIKTKFSESTRHQLTDGLKDIVVFLGDDCCFSITVKDYFEDLPQALSGCILEIQSYYNIL